MSSGPERRPLQLYPSDLRYGTDLYRSLFVELALRPGAAEQALSGTPFQPASDIAWIEATGFVGGFGIRPFDAGGILVAARYGDTVGAHYAYSVVSNDESLALGREPFGYPKVLGATTILRVGDVVAAETSAPGLRFRSAAVLDDRPGGFSGPRYPHLLHHRIPNAESEGYLLERVVARDTSEESTVDASRFGEGSFEIEELPAGLDWLGGAGVTAASFSTGSFRSTWGRVLDTLSVGAELSAAKTARAE